MIVNSIDFTLMDIGLSLFTKLMLVQFSLEGNTCYSLHPSEDLTTKGDFIETEIVPSMQ